MDIFLKVTAGVLITAILTLVLSKQGAELSLLLTLCVCCMVVLAAAAYLEPVLEFTRKLIAVSGLREGLLQILMKVVGIGLISQVASLVCADAGNQSLGKTLQILTTAVILCICVPMLEEILSLLEILLEEI